MTARAHGCLGGAHSCHPSCTAAAWCQGRRAGGAASLPLAWEVPEGLQAIDAGNRGRGLAARRDFVQGELIAQEDCPVFCASGHSSSSAKSLDASEKLAGLGEAELATLLSAGLLLWSEGSDALQSLPPGPVHWLELPKMRAQLEARCRSVQQLLAEGRRQKRFSLSLDDEAVMAAELRRIGGGLGKAAAAAVPGALSLLNHSCSPNARLQLEGPRASLVALGPIAAGEEVTVSYVDELDHVLARRYFLLEQQGFRCLCARCQANFSGVVSPTLGGWRCRRCGSAVLDEALECSSCGAAVPRGAREEREALQASALQLLGRATRQPAQAGDLLQEALGLLRQARPEGSTLTAKALALLRSWGMQQAPLEAQKALQALRESHAAQRASLAWEAAGLQPVGAPAGDVWARRLVDALRLYEPTEAGARKGRKRHAGPAEDGGYVVWETPGRLCDSLLSYGVDTNVDFELELACSGSKVTMFDHTVQGPPKRHPNFSFRREALAEKDVPGVCGTLASHLQALQGRVMLKMDVEGAEFAALLSAPEEVLARFDQVCIELHWLGRPSRGGDFRQKALALERLAEHFVLLHAHGNSYGDIVDVAGCRLPDVLEALYVNRRLLCQSDVRPSQRGIPDPVLDVNNCAFLPDIALTGAPFGAALA